MNREQVAWSIAAGLLLALVATVQWGREGYEGLEAAQDSIEALEPEVERLTEVADSLRPLAFRSDTVRVYVERAATADLDRAREEGLAIADSLRATLDSQEAELLANLEATHEAEKAAIWRIADMRQAWGENWRAFALTSDSLVKVQQAQLAMHDIVNTGLRNALRQERQQVWLSRSAAALGVVAVLVLK